MSTTSTGAAIPPEIPPDEIDQVEREKIEKRKERGGPACERLRQDAKKCIKDSDCVQIQRRSARDCVNSGDIPDQCIAFLSGLSSCKQAMVDPRARFRGRPGDMDP